MPECKSRSVSAIRGVRVLFADAAGRFPQEKEKLASSIHPMRSLRTLQHILFSSTLRSQKGG